MSDITYLLSGGKGKDLIPLKVQEGPGGLPTLTFDSARYVLLGGVRKGSEFELSQEEDGYDGHTSRTVLTQPGNMYTDVKLIEVVRREIEVGDNLVGIVIDGAPPYNHIQQGSVTLLPPRVTAIKRE